MGSRSEVTAVNPFMLFALSAANNSARPLQERPLMLAAVMLHRRSQGVRREPQLAVALEALDGFGARLRYTLGGERRLLAA